MAKEFYGYFDSATGDERSYDASEFARVLGAGTQNGITSHSGGGMRTTPAGGMQTKVSAGGIVINGYLYVLSDDGGNAFTLAHGASGGAERIDRIVARLNLNGNIRNITLSVLAGTPAAAPVAPALTRNGQIYEMSIARIRIRAAATTIEANDITDERANESVCGQAVPVWLSTATLNASYAHSAITSAQIDAILGG